MNKRITELWEQATFDESRVIGGVYHPYVPLQIAGQPTRFSVTEEQQQKFAELLIEEVEALCKSIQFDFRNEEHHSGMIDMRNRIVWKIKSELGSSE